MKSIEQPDGEQVIFGQKPGAAVYVRVSDYGQLGRDGSEDGYSLPAQEAGVSRKAQELEADIAKVYVERAESARTDDRPVLQQMLRELPTLGVRYLIVHKVDRLARDRIDDGLLYRQLISMGITLVSATENIDETPAGRMMHGILATLAEFYSNNLALEIKKGLYEKHRQGGTPFKPPIGYLPHRELIAGQDIRSVVTDQHRAPFVKLAFDLYATGDWSLIRLRAHLESMGLRGQATRKRAAKPLALSSVERLLKNRYYLGEVTYAGKTVQGRHEPLVDHETFNRVQEVLKWARKGRSRAVKHDPYLSGSLFCAECGRRMVYSKITNRHGTTYHYFTCLGRASRGHGGTCNAGHFQVDAIERAIENLYASISIPEVAKTAIREEMQRFSEEETGVIRRAIERHEADAQKIKAKQAKLLELAYEDLIAPDVLRAERDRLREEERAIANLIKRADGDRAELLDALDEALSRYANVRDDYVNGSESHRKMLNRWFFDRIEVGPEGMEGDTIDAVVMSPVPDALRAWLPTANGSAKTAPVNRLSSGQEFGRVLQASTSVRKPRCAGLSRFGDEPPNGRSSAPCQAPVPETRIPR